MLETKFQSKIYTNETKSKTWLQKGLLLSAAVSPSKKVMDAGYDIPSIARDLDWIAVMTYDYHGHWDKKTGHVSPMHAHPEDDYDYFNSVSLFFLSSFQYNRGSKMPAK